MGWEPLGYSALEDLLSLVPLETLAERVRGGGAAENRHSLRCCTWYATQKIETVKTRTRMRTRMGMQTRTRMRIEMRTRMRTEMGLHSNQSAG